MGHVGLTDGTGFTWGLRPNIPILIRPRCSRRGLKPLQQTICRCGLSRATTPPPSSSYTLDTPRFRAVYGRIYVGRRVAAEKLQHAWALPGHTCYIIEKALELPEPVEGISGGQRTWYLAEDVHEKFNTVFAQGSLRHFQHFPAIPFPPRPAAKLPTRPRKQRADRGQRRPRPPARTPPCVQPGARRRLLKRVGETKVVVSAWRRRRQEPAPNAPAALDPEQSSSSVVAATAHDIRPGASLTPLGRPQRIAAGRTWKLLSRLMQEHLLQPMQPLHADGPAAARPGLFASTTNAGFVFIVAVLRGQRLADVVPLENTGGRWTARFSQIRTRPVCTVLGVA